MLCPVLVYVLSTPYTHMRSQGRKPATLRYCPSRGDGGGSSGDGKG